MTFFRFYIYDRKYFTFVTVFFHICDICFTYDVEFLHLAFLFFTNVAVVTFVTVFTFKVLTMRLSMFSPRRERRVNSKELDNL